MWLTISFSHDSHLSISIVAQAMYIYQQLYHVLHKAITASATASHEEDMRGRGSCGC